MSKETDGIVAKHANSGLGGHVTSITSSAPGRAVGTYHERKATPSATDKIGKGLAVDFGDDTGDTKTASKMAIFNLFAQDSASLAELFHSHADFYVKNGRRYPIADLDRGVYNDHFDHIHVAVAKGTVLASAPLNNTKANAVVVPTTVSEDNVPAFNTVMDADYTPTLNGSWRVEWGGGVITSGDAAFFGSMGGQQNPHGFVSIARTASGKGHWLLAEDGGIYAFGDAQFYGSYWNIPEKDRQGVRSFVSVKRISYADGEGYRIMGTDGSWYDFSPQRAAELRAKGTLG
ncbi:hypothetical protein GTQ99_00150 [Kineococcus sp. T13]|uniref:hypothetical protein n=1 Tax=Kineococcus vitellinus TaxID=2696565 RepID=UPI0014132F91|nr:hypothetical protein [Kineococcus vitellinus]NAZ73841.1 hypothetical protein [Kineococcus vitellinus]